MPKTPTYVKGDRVRVTYESDITLVGRVGDRLPSGSVTLGSHNGWTVIVPPDLTTREIVSVEIIKPPRPAFQDGDVVRSTASPGEVAVRAGGKWRWTTHPATSGWHDEVTADHLDSGYKTAIRVGGEAA